MLIGHNDNRHTSQSGLNKIQGVEAMGIDECAIQQDGIEGFGTQTPKRRAESRHMRHFHLSLPRLLEHGSDISRLHFILPNQ
jgi:hypothetical protein